MNLAIRAGTKPVRARNVKGGAVTLAEAMADQWTRTIPTRVGNTILKGAAAFDLPDHPHACGEYQFSNSAARAFHGPSPRVWGIHLFSSLYRARNRTIPTRVGNTFTGIYPASAPADHPHACGEYFGNTRTGKLDSMAGDESK